jgi:glycogen synthase
VKAQQLKYKSKELKPLREWLDGKEKIYAKGKYKKGKDTPINSNLELRFDMNESEDVQLIKNLAPFALPPFSYGRIHSLSYAEKEVKHFLAHSIGQLNVLNLNYGGDLLNGRDWVEAIVKVFSKVKEKIYLCKFSFSKEQVEAIVDKALHLRSLGIEW